MPPQVAPSERLTAHVAIASMADNRYFHSRATALFASVTYLPSRPDRTTIIDLLRRTDVIILGVREAISADMLAEAGQVRTLWIGSLTVGVDHLDVEALTAHGIGIINAPTANVTSVAEHILAMTLALSKVLVPGTEAVRLGTPRERFPLRPSELSGKTFGTIGVGNIGQTAARLAAAFDMRTIGSSRSFQSGHKDHLVGCPLPALLASSDVISISVPLTTETTSLIDQKSLSLVKPGALLVNTSRDEIVDYTAIQSSLESARLGGFGSDGDKTPAALAARPDVVATPHIAGLTSEASDRMDNEVIDGLARALGET